MDLNAMVQNQGWIKDDAYGGTGLYVTRIALADPDTNNPTWIDNVFISGSSSSCKRINVGIYVVPYQI